MVTKKDIRIDTEKGIPMSLNKAIENLKFDKRLTELNLKLGRVTEEELKQQAQKLEDLQNDCERLDLDGEDTDDSDLI